MKACVLTPDVARAPRIRSELAPACQAPGPTEDDSRDDWDDVEFDPTNEPWEADGFEDGEEAQPERGDFWGDSDDFND